MRTYLFRLPQSSQWNIPFERPFGVFNLPTLNWKLFATINKTQTHTHTHAWTGARARAIAHAPALLFSVGLGQPANKQHERTQLYRLSTVVRRIFILCTLVFINSGQKECPRAAYQQECRRDTEWRVLWSIPRGDGSWKPINFDKYTWFVNPDVC